MLSSIRRRASLGVGVALVAATLLAGCSTTEDAAGSPAAADGKLTQKTIGILNVTTTSESTVRPQEAIIAALDKAGWKHTVIDAQGDPQKSAAGLQSFVTQKVDAVISIANQPGAIQSGLVAAQAAGIPVINIAGAVPDDPLLSASYAPDEEALSKALNSYMLDHLADKEIATITAPSLYALGLRDGFLADALEGTDVATVANHEIDFTNPVQDTQKAVTDILSAHPDVAAFWTDTDFDVQPTAEVLKSKNLCGKVQVYGFYGGLANLEAVRQGCATAVVETAIDASGPMAVDALLAYFVNGTEIPRAPEYDEDFFKPTIIDSTNVPSDPKAYFPPPSDFTKYFYDKWADEYGI